MLHEYKNLAICVKSPLDAKMRKNKRLMVIKKKILTEKYHSICNKIDKVLSVKDKTNWKHNSEECKQIEWIGLQEDNENEHNKTC